jgi:hypothetical protein
MVTSMFDPRVRPRYPLDDSWLFADPMNLALEGEQPARDAARSESHGETGPCAARNLDKSLGAGVSRACQPCLAKGFTIRVRMCAIAAFAGAIWLYLGTDTRWQGSEVTSAIASVAAVNCPQRSGSNDALRTL